MSFTVNLSGGGLLINRFNSSNMLKSTQEKLQRQQERDNKVAFFEAQKENLKNRKADSLEEISEKLENQNPQLRLQFPNCLIFDDNKLA